MSVALPKLSISLTSRRKSNAHAPQQITPTSSTLPAQPPANSEPAPNIHTQNAEPTLQLQSEPPTPSEKFPGASALNAVRLLDKLLGVDEEEKDRENQESRFDDGLDFYDISFDEVDDRISAFQEDEFVQEAFAKGMDLREYARQIESELGEIEEAHELDYTKQIRSFIDLHGQIQSCDQILGTMEELLSVFQSDLGNISGEIQSLQERSSEMNIKLRNRKVRFGKVESGLMSKSKSGRVDACTIFNCVISM
ncbi:hypothetical protein BC936DRAFT_145867 [Jimgerdemannia flammicorona]|uniref:Vps52 coiled-coil domain-containing protein n=1 Tax=Jimgerdemannia flammicorona TaxID=994334 RepID=A0A433D8X2_9FUNG|nr:hypothetical protein BC936DRAFT_145867 [Jimgerdemannia flammicorona]